MDSQPIQQQIFSITKTFLKEVHPDARQRHVSLDANLEADLGIDSLGRVELMHRMEQAFQVFISDTEIMHIETLGQLLDVITQANPKMLREQRDVYGELEKSHVDPKKITTLISALQAHAESEPERPHIYFQDEHGHETILTYGELYLQARKLAKGLVERGIKPGDNIAIMLPTTLEFFPAFMGVLWCGAIPVPIYPPYNPAKIEEYCKREAKILNNAEVRLLITFDDAKALSKLLCAFIPSLRGVSTVGRLLNDVEHTSPPDIDGDSPALIQYTSGSTGTPKGVLLSHHNIISNIHGIVKAGEVTPQDVLVSWLPLYHDMGLIAAWLGCLLYGNPLVLMSPMSFLIRPERWLWAIHYHRGTLSAAPNFAYELCTKKIPEHALEGLDLSSWRLAFNGAEAVNPNTIHKFIERFTPYGFKAENMFPVYGLAENAVALTFPDAHRVPRIDYIQREAFESQQKAIPEAAAEKKHRLAFVSSGKVLPEHEIRIVDHHDNVLSEREIGLLQFRGPSSMQGYYHNPEVTAAAFHDGWWDTGDLAYIADKELFVTGRQKDMIITAGRNIYPEEVEDMAKEVPGVRGGAVVAFGVVDPALGTESLTIVAETSVTNASKRNKIKCDIIEKVSAELGLPPHQVILVPVRSIPKTSSGKLQRSATKDAFVKGELGKKDLRARWQILKLSFSYLGTKIKNLICKSGRVLYSCYVGLTLGVVLPPILIAMKFCSKRVAAKVFRFNSRLLFRLMFCPIKVYGKEYLALEKPVIYVPNHASYADSVLLAAILPADVLFVAKKEILQNFLFGTVAQKLGYLTVDRTDFAKGLKDTENIEDALRKKQSLVIYPEGTCTYATGLRPFKLGAFKVAVETQTPICPIAIQGSRKLLRPDTLLFKPSTIKIFVNPPIAPQGTDFQEVTRLKRIVRQLIAKDCGESSIM